MTTKQEKQTAAIAAIKEATLARISLNEDTKTIDLKEGNDLYTDALAAAEVTVDQARAVHEVDTNFAAGVAGAFVQVSTEGFKGNKDLQELNYEVGMLDKNKLQLMASRTHGLSVGVTTTVVNHKAGALKRVFSDFNDAMDALAKA